MVVLQLSNFSLKRTLAVVSVSLKFNAALKPDIEIISLLLSKLPTIEVVPSLPIVLRSSLKRFSNTSHAMKESTSLSCIPVDEDATEWKEDTLDVGVCPIGREGDVKNVVAIRLQVFAGQVHIWDVIRHHLRRKNKMLFI
jgi:hypothetical protein